MFVIRLQDLQLNFKLIFHLQNIHFQIQFNINFEQIKLKNYYTHLIIIYRQCTYYRILIIVLTTVLFKTFFRLNKYLFKKNAKLNNNICFVINFQIKYELMSGIVSFFYPNARNCHFKISDTLNTCNVMYNAR